MTTAIIDIGSGFIKAGLQTDPLPTCVFPSFVGRPRRRYTHLYEGDSVFVGDDAVENRHQLCFEYPIDHGHVEKFDDLERILSYTLTIGLTFSPSGSSILLTEPPFASMRHRETLTQCMFESFDAGEVNLSVQGAIALYATGRVSGIVVEIGDGITQIVPVHEGYTDKAVIRRNDFGGQELTMYLQKLLCDLGYPLTMRDEFEAVRILKEIHCYTAMDPAAEDQRDDLEVTYQLPDGITLRDGRTSISLGPERFYCAEALFDPRLVQRDCPPLTELVWQAAQAAPLEIRRTCLNSVILSGGSTLFPGLQERLEHELKKLSPIQSRSSVKVYAAEDRLFGVWLGAKLFSDPALRSMQDMYWITKEEWNEEGPHVVERKTPFRVKV